MRIASLVGLIVALSLYGASNAQTGQSINRQAIYDAAQAAFDKDAWAEASDGFAKLLPTNDPRPLSRSEAVIASRYAEAILHLQRTDEAEAWIDRSLAAPPSDDPAQLVDAWMTKGAILRYRLDYSGAMVAYDKAAVFAASTGDKMLLLNARLSEGAVGATVDPSGTALHLSNLASDPTVAKAVGGRAMAELEDIRARVALNQGDKAAAIRLANRAVVDSGGLTEKVTTLQVAIRADAGIIAKLGGDDEEANKYFTYTGAGHLKDISWVNQHSGTLPVCDEDVHPTDSVVVALAIADDGRVIGALPIYASRPGQLGTVFARVVSRWRWDPEAIKNVDGFWRSTLQLGLRCVTRPLPEQLDKPIRKDTLVWLAQHGLLEKTTVNKEADTAEWSVRADDPRLSGPGGPVLSVYAGPRPKNEIEVDKLWRALDAEQAPPSAYALLISKWADEMAVRGGSIKEYARVRANLLGLWSPRFFARFPHDRAGAWLRLSQALALQDSGDFADAQPLFASILASQDTGGQGDDALRGVSLLHQAISLEKMGRLAESKASLDASGLNENMCSLLDTHPVQQSLNPGDIYPQDAERWQFEGFAQEAFDISENGHVDNVRTVVAYPPYIFEKAAELGSRRFTYIPPHLGGRPVGCESNLVTLQFRVGG